MKISIIFHSVCANNYLIAKIFYKNLKTKDQNVSLYRVADSDWTKQENTPPIMQITSPNFIEAFESLVISPVF